MNYILHYDYAALAIMVFTLYFLLSRKDMSRRDNRVLLILTLMNLFSAIADITAIKVQSDVPRFGLGPGKFWNTAYLLVHTQMGLVLIFYIIELLGIRAELGGAGRHAALHFLGLPLPGSYLFHKVSHLLFHCFFSLM